MSDPSASWKSEFSTNFQVEKKITTEESLRIIEDAERNGVTVNRNIHANDATGDKVYISQAKTEEGVKISDAVRKAESQPGGTNPFGASRGASLFQKSQAKTAQKPMVDLTK